MTPSYRPLKSPKKSLCGLTAHRPAQGPLPPDSSFPGTYDAIHVTPRRHQTEYARASESLRSGGRCRLWRPARPQSDEDQADVCAAGDSICIPDQQSKADGIRLLILSRYGSREPLGSHDTSGKIRLIIVSEVGLIE